MASSSKFSEIEEKKFSDSNWTEWGTFQGVIERVISKSDEREARGRFEITVMITEVIDAAIPENTLGTQSLKTVISLSLITRQRKVGIDH